MLFPSVPWEGPVPACDGCTSITMGQTISTALIAVSMTASTINRAGMGVILRDAGSAALDVKTAGWSMWDVR